MFSRAALSSFIGLSVPMGLKADQDIHAWCSLLRPAAT